MEGMNELNTKNKVKGKALNKRLAGLPGCGLFRPAS